MSMAPSTIQVGAHARREIMMNDGACAGLVGRRDHTTSGGTTIAGGALEGVGLGAVSGGGGGGGGVLEGVSTEEVAVGESGGGMESCLGSAFRVSRLGYMGEGW
jgi:hypothetical protein